MLDLNHPRTPIIFEAARYTDRFREGCNNYVLANFEDRQFIFFEMELLCEEFTAFCKTNYPEKFEEIKGVIDEILAEIEKLKVIDTVTDEGNCTVCNSKLVLVKLDMKDYPDYYYCNQCPSLIFDLAHDIDMYTGAIFI